LFNNCRALQAQSFVNPQAGSHAQNQVGPFAARAEDEKHPETEGEGEMTWLSEMEYLDWMMVAGAVLLVLGFIGFVFSQNRRYRR
jgi:hypothetical protein